MIQLDDWQKEVLDYDGDICLCTGRRIGKTEIFSIKAINLMAKKKCAILIVSLTEEQAMIINNMMLRYAQDRFKSMIATGKNKPTLKTLTLKNGSKCFVRPVGATGDSLRGFEADILYVDEASRMPPMFWMAAKPVILTKAGKIWMSSTPHGKKGYFWDRFNESYNQKDPKARFKVIYKTTEEVLNNRPICKTWTQEQRDEALNIMERDRKEMSKLEFGQEYLGLFMEDVNNFFSDELIDKCLKLKRQKTEGVNYLGVDIARMGGDKCSYEVICRNGDKFFHVESITRQYQLTTKTEQDIIDVATMFECKKVGIDAGSGSLGVGIHDRLLQHPILKYLVVAMNNRDIMLDREGKKKQRLFKEDMYNNLKSMMERDEILLLDDDDLRMCLKSIQYEYDEKGSMRIFAHPSADIVEGLIRAAYLARDEKIVKLQIRYI
jgi:hypothetical protein